MDRDEADDDEEEEDEREDPLLLEDEEEDEDAEELLLLSSLLEFLRLAAELFFFSLSLLFLSFSDAALDDRDLLPPRAISFVSTRLMN